MTRVLEQVPPQVVAKVQVWALAMPRVMSMLMMTESSLPKTKPTKMVSAMVSAWHQADARA
jgi:hypothetical protein